MCIQIIYIYIRFVHRKTIDGTTLVVDIINYKLHDIK